MVELPAADTPLPRRNLDYPLSGEWSDRRDCHVRPDLVLIYRKPHGRGHDAPHLRSGSLPPGPFPADERTGDLMREAVDVDAKVTEIDPMREASPLTAPNPPDWLAFAGNWRTEWERTGDTMYRDKIVAGMGSIVKMPYGFLSGPNQLYGYDPATGKLYPMAPDGFGTYNLATIMGGGEVVFELNELIDHAGWNKVWNQYCRLHTAPKSVVARDNTTGTEGEDARYARPGRLSAYLYRQTKNPAYAAKALSGVRIPNMTTRSLKGPDVLNAIEEVSGLSTNSVSQGCLEAMISFKHLRELPNIKEVML